MPIDGEEQSSDNLTQFCGYTTLPKRHDVIKHLIVVLLLTTAAAAQSYTTNFPLTEDPACGGGVKYDGLLVHDLRRTGARNLRREGVGEGAIMKIGGWKTASVFRRYDIVSDSDLKEAAQKLNAKRERLKAQREQQQHSTSQQVQNQNDSKLTMIGPSGTAVANSDAVN